jgi:ferredoxin-NADP reductase
MIKKIKRLLQGNLLKLNEIVEEGSGTVSYRFHFDKDLTWKAGQHGIFRIENPKIKKSIRPFSISSSPSEGFIQITTSLNANPLSEFKSALSNMKPGDTIRMFGPAGSMIVGEKRNLVMIAGGLGITPFRAIINEYQKDKIESLNVNLIYIDSSSNYLFLSEIQDSKVAFHRYTDKDEFYNKVLEITSVLKNNADYMISGSPRFVKSVKKSLESASISSKSIRKDPFFGSK